MLATLAAAAAAAAEATAEAGHKSGGLPQLNTHDFVPQLIWLAVTFVALYLILSRVSLPSVGEVIAERRDRINRDLDAAAKLKSDTDKALADYEKALADARSKASGIAKQTRQSLSAETDAERAKVESQLAAKMQEAEARITATKNKALASVSAIAADTATAIVGKLIGQDVSPADVKAALATSTK
ncbi:MAG: F0F1 ATP synthase subunit B' [Hyphomicrobium sp.]